MKAVVNHYENYYGIIILGNCNMLDLNIDYSLNERSITVYRLTCQKTLQSIENQWTLALKRQGTIQNSCQKSYPNHEKKKTSTKV